MHIVLTGGGTAGHVTPQLAIVEAIRARTEKVRITYLGSYHGIEGELARQHGLAFEPISTGKFRRYFDLKNFVDFFRVPLGLLQAIFKLHRLRPDLVFSKGGYVAVPVVLAAWLLKIPVIIHESDSRPGLATRICAPLAQKILLGFEEAKPHLGRFAFKALHVGNPIRQKTMEGKVERAKKLTGFSGQRPVLLIMGGSSGSQEVNRLLQSQKKQLLPHFDLLHLTGEGKGKAQKKPHFFALPYAGEELTHLYGLVSLALSRAGAGSLAELEALQIPALLAPLGRNASRGEQMENARILAKKSKLFKILNPKKPLLTQLQSLPPRPPKRKANSATEKILKALEL